VTEHLRQERDEALAALGSAEADMAVLRNLNQRLMVETVVCSKPRVTWCADAPNGSN